MNSLEQDLDIVSGRIAELEKTITLMEENIFIMTSQLKETQLFLIKLAKNQHEISKRITQWPYIAVNSGMGDDEV